MRDNADYVELRIHGVSGTPPVDMLDRPLVKQVAGDLDGRFYRPVDAAGHEVRADDGHVIEGYHWGPITSGSWRQALWFVLIPFGLVNAAYFMLPSRPARVSAGALRALAVVLTCAFVLAMAQAVVDLLAWQWTGLTPAGAAGPRAADPRWWLAGGFGAVVLFVVVVRFLTGSDRTVPDTGDWQADAAEYTAIADRDFYRGAQDIATLRGLHVTAALSLLAVLASAVNREHVDRLGADLVHVVAVALLVTTVLRAAFLGNPPKPRGKGRQWLVCVQPRNEYWLAVALLAGSVAGMAAWDRLPDQPRGVLPGVAELGAGITVVCLLALVALFAAKPLSSLLPRSRTTQEPPVPHPFRPFLRGMTAPVVASLAVFLAVAFTTALNYGVLRLLRPPEPERAMELPLFHLRIAYAAGVAAIVAVAVGLLLVVLVAVAPARENFVTKVRLAVGDTPLPAGREREVARAWWLAGMKYLVHWVALAFAVVGIVLSVVAVSEGVRDVLAAGGVSAATVCQDSGMFGWLSGCEDLPGPDLLTVGTAALLLLGAGLVYLGRRSLGDSAFRRNACVAWDIVAFWPATVHPFVPPPYSPKVIEDLRRRVAWHLGECYELAPGPECTCPKPERPASRVVLAGHSQGSLIAVAALSRLSSAYRDRVALLTFGSQLQVAYARAFPLYVSHRFLCWLQGTVLDGRWRSLYRETDPVGGPVLTWSRNDRAPFTSFRLDAPEETPDDVDTYPGVRCCGPEWRLLDPCLADGVRTPHTAMRRHSSYSLDPAWDHALAELTRT